MICSVFAIAQSVSWGVVGLIALAVGVAGVALGAATAWSTARRARSRIAELERDAEREKRLAEIGAMTAGLAHEIKNPLSTIGLNAQLLGEAIDELEPPEEDAERLQRRIATLRREIDRLKDILESFLSFAGEVRLSRAPTDLNELIDELGDFFVPQAQRLGVQLRVDKAPTPIIANIDAQKLKQSILNMMINAAQAMSPRTSGAAEDAPNERELILKTEAQRSSDSELAVIHVIDTGPGIVAEDIKKIFTPYFTTKPAGSGLGLPISRRIVEEHGGRLEVHSEVGRGTDFVILLPIQDTMKREQPNL